MHRKSIKFVAVLLLIFLMLVLVACANNEENNEEENIDEYKQTAILAVKTARDGYLDSLYSIENISVLNSILEKAIFDINGTNEKDKVDLIVSQAKTDFSNISTMKQEEEKRQDAIKKEFANYKRDRQSELDEYRSMLKDSDYSSENVKKLNEILATAKKDIFYAETFEDVLNVYTDAVDSLLAVLTVNQEKELLLKTAISDAILELNNYRATKINSDYSEENCAYMDRIVESTTKQIKSSNTVEEIENFLHYAIGLLDAVEPLGQSELEKAKSIAITAIRQYHFRFDYEHYTVDGQNELTNILNDAIDKIQLSENQEKIDEIVETAKTSLNSVKTYAELFAEYKPKVKESLIKHRSSKSDEMYSEEGVNSLNLILQNAINALANATTFEMVDKIASETISALDDVNVLETELVKIKNSKIAELTAYHASFDPANYTTAGFEELNQILVSSKQNIMNAPTLADVNDVYEISRLQMNAVLTISQELAQRKAAAVEELNAYRLVFEDSNYSATGIRSLNIALSDGINSINLSANLLEVEEALELAKDNLYNVMDYVQELQYLKDKAKNEINEIRNSKNNAAYSSSGVEQLNQIVTTYTEKINAVRVIEDIEILKSKAIEELNAVPIYSQQLRIEIAQKVVELKEYHAKKLTQKYTDDGAVLLEMALQDGIAAIQNSKSFEQLYELFSKTKTNLDEVKTYEEELTDAKQVAESSIRLYRDTKLNSLYTEDGIISLDNILNNTIESIWLADNFIMVNQLVDKGKSSLDNVLTHAQELVTYKKNWIEDLRDYRDLKQKQDYSADGFAKLDQALQTGIDEINSAQTIAEAEEAFNRAKINLDSIPNLNQGEQMIRDNACKTLKAHRESKNNSEYNLDGIEALDFALKQGLQKINNAKTEEAIRAALSESISEIDAVKTIADLLNEYKDTALSQLRSYRESKKDSEYSSNGISQLNNILRDGEIAIDKALTIDEIDDVLQSAKNDLDAVLTEKEENNFDIWELRNKALEELQSYRDNLGDDNYGPEGINELDNIIMNAMPIITEALTPSDIAQIVEITKENLQAVQTYKNEYQNKIYSYRESFKETDYNADGLEALDAVTQQYVALIANCADKDNAENIYVESVKAMDEVLQKNGDSRAKIKISAIEEIMAYRENKNRADYSEESNSNLDTILSDAIEQIEASSSQQQIQETLINSKKRMDSVLTVAQNQAIIWVNQYRELFDDENYSDEDSDELDNIVERFRSNILSCTSLPLAMIEAAKEMDSIKTLTGECRQIVKYNYINQIKEYKEKIELSNYSPDSKAMLESLLYQYIGEIQLSFDMDTLYFDQVVTEAKAAMDNVPTLKDEAVTELTSYRATFEESQYSDEAIAELDRILQEFATTEFEPSQIQNALAEAKAAMDNVPTLKDEAITALETYRATFEESQYSNEAIAELDRILQEFVATEFGLNQIQNALSEAKAAMDNVPTLKDEAITELETYRATFEESQYSDDAIAELDRILQEFIETEFEPDQIQNALVEAKAAMDSVAVL